MGEVPATEWTAWLRLGSLAVAVASLPLAWVWLRRGAAGDLRGRLAALTALTLFLTFDLIVFGSFTRLTDSGLGCPDWPGCYGHASPIGAGDHIDAAQAVLPDGPVTPAKAWIEMIHRYLAMTVGVLVIAITAASWVERRHLPHSPWWPTLTLLWVVVQGLFGRYTVTWKLYPAIVTAHLIGGLLLLALLAWQHESFRARPVPLGAALRLGVVVVGAIVMVQIALGGWVSTNYAVLACQGFPQCNGAWWPQADFGAGFTVLRELGHDGTGALLGFDALVAIHLAHRAFALVALAALGWLAWRLARSSTPSLRRFGRWLGALTALQAATGLSNIVLGWPMLAALLHAGGAAAIVGVLALLAARGLIVARPAAAPLHARVAETVG